MFISKKIHQATSGYENDGIFDWSQASATEPTANAELQKQVGTGPPGGDP